MSGLKFNEDSRVKFPATVQFLRLGYEYQSLKVGEIDNETKIFINRFKPSIEKINGRSFDMLEIVNLISEVNTVIKNNDLGKEFYNWLINPLGKVKLIDLDNIDNNDFAVVNELFFGEKKEGSFRPDISVLINGIPLAFLEVKKPNNEGGIQKEFTRMINKRIENPDFKKYLNMIQFVTFSNNMEYENTDDTMAAEDIKAGSFYTVPNGKKTNFSFFREEEPKIDGFKDIEPQVIEDILRDNGYNPSHASTEEFKTSLDRTTPCNSFITSFFDKERIIYFLKYGIAYIDDIVHEKQCMRYPQYFAAKNIIKRLESGGKNGIIFHTQGSGKTNLSAYSIRIIRDYYAKKSVNARFYFVVDRLDLLTQSSREFRKNGIHVINVNNRTEFSKELNKTISTNISMDSIGEITVVNIHKFSDTMPVAKNDYSANVQRIFFIDEAHRSYSNTGEFFKNLMLVDNDAVFIALTGTPLLSKKERSNLKFGDYIHKYFYDKSIADGYTLRIKKEQIDTAAKIEIKKNLEIENADLDKNIIKESDDYINALGKFIEKDFDYFRLTNADKTIGGMVVCASNNQAKKIKNWFDENSKFVTGLVITDESIPSQANKQTQINFKETLVPDILIVHQMLTTGYSVNRLKKMYLLRNAREHTLLQTISRVNRPYKSPNGKVYQYGYIVDFVDIEAEYDRTIDLYLKELEQDLNDNGEDEGSLDGLVIGPDDINKKYLSYKKALEEIIDTSNLELFSRYLTKLKKDTLLNIKRLLNGIRTCYTEFLLSRAIEYASQIDIGHNKKLITEVQHRIDFINLTSEPTDMLSIISNDEVVEIIYEFIKTKIIILDLGKFIEKYKEDKNVQEVIKSVQDIQNEMKKNKNRNQSELVQLDEFLKKIFSMLEISNLDDLPIINSQLAKALQELRRINAENDRLAAIYDGNYAFVKSYTDCLEQHPALNNEDVESVVITIYEFIKDVMDKNTLILQGRENFVNNVKKNTTTILIKSGLYKKLKLKEWYSAFLSNIYTNLQLYK